MAVSFIGGGNRSTRRKPPTCCKSLTNFITLCCRVLLAMNTINQPNQSLKTFWGHIKKTVLTCILIGITFLSKFYHTFVGCAENINKIMMKAAMPAREIKFCGLFHTDVMMITIIPITTAVIHNLKIDNINKLLWHSTMVNIEWI